jgi:hypothetical protein
LKTLTSITAMVLLSVFGFSVAQAATEPASSAAATAAKKKSTDVSFEDVLVQGKYHFSDEAVTTVEEDKVLDGLLNVRKDFKDRMKRSAARQ